MLACLLLPSRPPACLLLQVMESWASILRGVRPNAFKITLEDVRVFALSETTGLVTCVEVVEADDSKGRWVGAGGLGLAGTAGAGVCCLVRGAEALKAVGGSQTFAPVQA